MIFTQWKYTEVSQRDTIVLPDGCRDILLIGDPDSEPEIRMTDWDYQSRSVRMDKGKSISGFRLRPGLFFNNEDLIDIGASESEIESFICSEADASRETTELIEALADPSASIQRIARRAGVSVRTLQRQFKYLGLPTLEYWRLLSRAKLAATALPCRVPLAHIAHEYGYSDQPHMTREFKKWFGITPAQLRANNDLLADVCQPGLGNWTLEHISIR